MLSRPDHSIPDLFIAPGYRWLRHLLIQVIVLLISINVFWDEPVRILPGRLGAWMLYFLLIDTILYVNMYLLVPRLLIRGRARLYIVLTSAFILLMVLGVGMLQDASDDDSNRIGVPVLIGISSGFFAFALFIAGLTSLQLLKYRMENARRISALENVTMEIELAGLQNQINPHFLFNMLNNANILVEEDVEKTSMILSKLNDLLFYQVESGSKDSVKLNDDIGFLNDYLGLEKIRRDRFTYDIEIEGDPGILVPPLLFIPFVENAVKHNPGNDSYVSIRFCVTDRRLYFTCRNPKAPLHYGNKEGGIGLQNITRRLDLLFGENYRLDLNDGPGTYTVIMDFSL